MTKELYITAISHSLPGSSAAWQELDTRWQAIKAKYPLLFTGRNIGTEVGFGWWALLEEAFIKLTALMQAHPDYKFNAAQIKEKFGGLRFYISIRKVDAPSEEDDDWTDETPREEDLTLTHLFTEASAIIDVAEDAAARTCEWCGEPGTSTTNGWIKVLCEEHKQLRKKLK